MKNPKLKHLGVDSQKKFVNVFINALAKKWKPGPSLGDGRQTKNKSHAKL